jgi:pimeloyl-ACP methyl ester carboxylesterase
VTAVHAQPPDADGWRDGLAWALFSPRQGGRAPVSGVVVLHGADSAKENHFDFARACRSAGLAALAFDARGHGASDGPMDARAIADVAVMADVLREQTGVAAVGLRGSSMGGYLSIVAAEASRAAAVVAICPASAAGLARGLRTRRFGFAVERDAVAALLAGHDEVQAAATLRCPILLLHAEGDEVVAVEHSRMLAAAAPASRLITVPGGHHRSVQHDPELQGEAVRFLRRTLGRPTAVPAG